MESQSPDSPSSSKSKSSSPEASTAGLEPLSVGSRGKKTRLPGMSPQMKTFALQQRPRTKRACATKVRTGCITCKRRHVKCDETRPFCLKCTKSPRGPGVCEGYGPDHSANRHSQALAPRRIAAKSAGTWRNDPVLDSRSSGDILLEPGYENVFFVDPEERGYFDFWRALVGSIYLFPDDVMQRILPQLARREPAIKHAALAMAGMARALVPSVRTRPRRELLGNGPHYEFALRHYGKAIRLVRTSPVSSENMLWAIICSVLFVTFECLHGDRNAALSHVNHAYKMMEHYFAQRSPRSLTAGSPSPTTTTTSSSTGPSCPSSPSTVSETDSIRSVCNDAAWIFQGLTMQSWSHNVLHSKDPAEISWCCRGSRRPLAVEEVPPRFADLLEARRWWRVVQHYTCHRCPIYTDMYADDLTPEMLAGSYVRNTPMPCEINELTAVLPEFLGHLQRWNAAFQPVYEELRQHWGPSSPAGSPKEASSPKAGGSPTAGSPTSPTNIAGTPEINGNGGGGGGCGGPGRDYDAYVEACNLRNQYLLLWTDVTSLSYKDIRTLKRLTPAFREMTQLSRVILEAQSNCGGCSEVFSMDNGPTLPLLQVACRCRDAALRREATDLLGKHHRRDGLWDSRTFHGIAIRNMGIETENAIVGGDDIEQWARVSRSEAHIDRHGELTGKILRWHAEEGEWRTVAERVAL